MNKNIIINNLIKKDLLMIHKSLPKEFDDAIKDSKVIFSKHFLGYGSIVIFFDNQKVSFVYSFNKTNKRILKYIDNSFIGNNNLVKKKEYEILINENKEVLNLFKKYNLKLCDSGSEYKLDIIPEAVKLEGLKNVKYNPFRVDEYIRIIDEAFNPLRDKMGKSLNYRKSHYKESVEKFNSSAIKNNLFIFEKDGEIVGICFLNANVIDTLVINPSFQGQNYGSIILSYISHILTRKKGYAEVYLYVVAENERAKNFYLRNGYRINAKYRVLKENCDEC